MDNKERVLGEWYEKYSSMLLSICLSTIHYDPIYSDIIDSCIQETFLIAYDCFDEVFQMENIGAWLARTCLNRLIPHAVLLRKRKSHEAFSIDDPNEAQSKALAYARDGPEELILKEERLNHFESLLSSQEHMVYSMYFIQGYSIKETAQFCRCSVTGIKAAILRIRKKASRAKHEIFF